MDNKQTNEQDTKPTTPNPTVPNDADAKRELREAKALEKETKQLEKEHRATEKREATEAKEELAREEHQKEVLLAAARREAQSNALEQQLQTWSTQLDALVASAIESGAQAHDPYRVRIDKMRDTVQAIFAKLNTFTTPSPAMDDGWSPFYASISNDLQEIEWGLADLSS